MKNKLFSFVKQSLTKETITDYLTILAGCIIQALGMVYFLIPARLISGGISGMAQVINALNGWPVGLMTLIGNIPLFVLGWRYLGKRKFALRTIFAVAMFSLFTDLINRLTPDPMLTKDIFLNTMFGAVVLGIGFGLVYRGSGTSGGSDIIGRILNQRLGFPMTQSYLLTDSISIILGGIVFGWDLAFYGIVAIYISGFAAEQISEGGNIFRSVYIISSEPRKIGEAVIATLDHSVTYLTGIGGYSQEEKVIVYCVVGRGEVNQLKRLVVEHDPSAFMVVSPAMEVLGEGFMAYKTLPN